jgi:hypothetical protein
MRRSSSPRWAKGRAIRAGRKPARGAAAGVSGLLFFPATVSPLELALEGDYASAGFLPNFSAGLRLRLTTVCVRGRRVSSDRELTLGPSKKSRDSRRAVLSQNTPVLRGELRRRVRGFLIISTITLYIIITVGKFLLL